MQLQDHVDLFSSDIYIYKGTVSVISSEPPCKDGNARFTMVPLTRVYLISNVEEMVGFLCLKLLNSNNSYVLSSTRNRQVSFVEKPQLKIKCFKTYKHQYLVHQIKLHGYRCESGNAIFA